MSPANIMLERIEAIPDINPAPTNTGINGIKILEMALNTLRTGVCLILAFWAA